ncbi:MAG: Fis family transcriptional regulator [Ignavibacteriales bacterium UTCHB2]|jgi:DNA-binding NtrC family response regulator|nr:MAG: Transcriptional regulatory protein ZraR [Ignavibacteria bacterium ADurb.Bin266]OQY73391.1 MAG: Fis family transcriptional regulator [Ignavibacteriales bacterium UTCHB2]HQI40281.1 sigma-54 dependent transcriptional regulator [Ignavibacteriaceae bacterium]
MGKREKILIVDDEKIVRESLYHWFEEDNYEVDTAEDGETALQKYEKGKYDILLVDMKMPGMSGLDLLTKVKEIDKDALVILITAFASVPTAITALKNGAFDYITKPVDPDELAHIVNKALEQRALKIENIQLKENIDEIIKPDNLIGESYQMRKVYELVYSVAITDTTVIIRGESGTGKELVAKAVHINSSRKYFPIITVNCGALSESLLESELFGHEKGSFTGAQFKRKGKFEMADRGTIFLDEIGSISPKMQVELLRVIEKKQFNRVGGNELIKSDFRVITATNEPLEELVKAGKFREDLYYRLNVFTIVIPPLRERRDDIPLLVNFFIKKFSTAMNKKVKTVSKEALDFLMNYNWPGNVRELENAIERAMVVGKSNSIMVEDLPFHLSSNNFALNNDVKSLAAMERKFILNTLNENEWNISKTAQILEIDRVTLYNKINKYNLSKNDY